MILVTGATGLVGSYLLHSLLSSGRQVRALLYNKKSIERTRKIFNSIGGDTEQLLQKVEWIEGDVLDTGVLYDAMKGVEHVYHCAAIVSFDPNDRNLMMKVNVEGTANVVNIALEHGVKKLCHVSSIASLGRTSNSDVVNEQSEWQNTPYNSRYSKSKYMAEREVWRGSAEGLPVIIVNPSIILGYGHPEKGSTRMFSTIYKNSKFYGKGTNGYVDVRDVVSVMVALMESEVINERFVVSGGNFTYKQIFSWIAEGFNKPVPRIQVPDLALEIVWRFEAIRAALSGDKPLITRETANTSKHDYYYSTKKLEDTLNYKFIPMEQTIKTICRVMEKELSTRK